MFKYQLSSELALQASYEGFMDVLKSVAKKVSDSFAGTLKKITDVTAKGIECVQTTRWNMVLGLSNPICNETLQILTFAQGKVILENILPEIVNTAKTIVLVYNKTKPISDLPDQSVIEKIKEQMMTNMDYSRCDGMSFGPGYSGNSGCNWTTTNTKWFVDQWLRLAKTGLPQDFIKITDDSNNQDTSPEVVKSVGMAKAFTKAYGKCIAECAKTILKLADTCGSREEEE